MIRHLRLPWLMHSLVYDFVAYVVEYVKHASGLVALLDRAVALKP